MPKSPKKLIVKQLAEEIDTFDIMISSLVELLEEKNIITQEEWEKKIKQRIDDKAKSTSYRDIQFKES